MIQLTQEFINSDTLQIFFNAISTGVLIGLVIGIFMRVTWWIWH